MKIAIIAFLLFQFSSFPLLYASDAGTDAMDFLRIPLGVKQIGMGETGVCGGEAAGIFYNPANVAFMENAEGSFAHGSLYEGISLDEVAVGMPLKTAIRDWGTIGVGVNILNVGDVQGFDSDGEATRNYEPKGKVISLVYGRKFLGDKLNAGLGIKNITEDLGDGESSALGFDIGASYVVPGGEWSLNAPLLFGFAMQNMGASASYGSKSEKVLQIMRAGFSWAKKFRENSLILSMEMFSPSSGEGANSFGLEWRIKEIFNFRFGYKMSGDADLGSGTRFGFGINVLNFSFDYAYSSYGELESVHRFGVGMKFGKVISLEGIGVGKVSAKEAFEQGMKYYNEGKFPEAVLEFNKVLEIEPTNEEAFEMMKKASEKIK